MITVVGEALIDLVIDPAGHVTAALGGAPFNTARACGRLGADVTFVGVLSDDRFGSMLRDQLVADGVDVSCAPVVGAPTTLAAAELDERGAASYRFYIEGTSAPALDHEPVLAADGVVFTGGLALVLEPMASTVEQLVTSATDDRVVVLDVNCRPLVIDDRDAYVERVRRVVARTAIVKVSDEDLAWLADVPPLETARRWAGEGPALVIVTMGGRGAVGMTSDGRRVEVGAPRVTVADTVGAGDSFMAGLIDGLWSADLLGADRRTALRRASDATIRVVLERCARIAAITVSRPGADPPRRSELS